MNPFIDAIRSFAPTGHIYSAQDEVEEWNEVTTAFPDSPMVPSEAEQALAWKLVDEEVDEARVAYDWLRSSDYQTPERLRDFALELTDIIVVTLRAASAYGIDLDPFFRIVMNANWTKFENEHGEFEPVIREDGKVLKGPKYDKNEMLGLALLEIERQMGEFDIDG